MARRITESWISAYFDGELPEADRRAFERLALEKPEVRACLDDFAALQRTLNDAERCEVPSLVNRQVWRNWRESFAVRAAAALATEALHDGELTPAQERLVRKCHGDALDSDREVGALGDLACARCPQSVVNGALRQLASDERAVTRCLTELPIEPAPADTVPSLMQAIAASGATAHPHRVAHMWRQRSFAVAVALTVLAGVGLIAVYANRLGANGRHERIAQDRVKPIPPDDESNGPWSRKPVGPSFAKAPNLDEPFFDPEWMPEPPKKALPVLAEDSLKKLDRLLRPGERIEVDGSRLTFVCLDVQRMFDRLYVVLQNNNVSNASGKADDNSMIAVEIAATPNELSAVLAELRKIEQDEERLIAGLDVAAPKNARKADEVDYKLASIKFHSNVTSATVGELQPIKPPAKKPDGKPPVAGPPVPPPKDPTVEPPKAEPPTADQTAPKDEKRKFLIVFRPQPNAKRDARE